MSLSVGKILTGRKATYQIVESLKANKVFKARVQPGTLTRFAIPSSSHLNAQVSHPLQISLLIRS